MTNQAQKDAFNERMARAMNRDEMFSLNDWADEELRALADHAKQSGYKTAYSLCVDEIDRRFI